MNIRCPQCDASIEVGTEHIFTKCPYCGVRLFYKKDGFLTKESIKPTHDSSVAVKLLKSITGKRLSVRMEYFSFYRIKSEGKTKFVPGKMINAYRVADYIPQGDRIPLDMDVEEPDFSIDVALEKAGVERADAIGIVYLPFFTARDRDTFFYVDAAKGNILSNTIFDQQMSSINQHPLAILASFLVLSFSFLPVDIIWKFIVVFAVTTGFWLYERG
ncbi:zinc ribbon domain-containing protein [candidate division WOR-3 bacterium]|nr:zinc ribbon domain-containing protein [candidate division WOR-3 bacterium]